MSKAHDPHRRYVALRLAGPQPPSRRALQNALLGRARREGVADEDAPQLTRYEWPHAIVRVDHTHLDHARQWLPRVDFAVHDGQKVPLHVQTLLSSGTIKTLTDRLGVLRRGRSAGQEPRRAVPRRPDP